MTYFGSRRKKMVNDERIRSSIRKITSQVFGIWYVLLLASLLYRQFYLGQPLRQYWDIVVIFFIGTSYATISMFARGAVYENRITKCVKWSVPTLLVTNVAVAYFRGHIKTIGDLIASVIGGAIGIALVGILLCFLYRRWEKKIDVSE
jgi:hypothetical protein